MRDIFSPVALHGQRLRDLVLRFPCAALDGVRWTVLCKVLRERFPVDLAVLQPSPSAELLSWIEEVAEPELDSSGELRLWLRDSVALTQGTDGQLACWPLLVRRLAEIVHSHGSLQIATAFEAGSGGDEVIAASIGAAGTDATGDKPVKAAAKDCHEVTCVLLSQIKPLLTQHWDASFDERAIGYFSEAGNHVNVKKLKHLLAELLKWRLRRRAMAKSSGQVTLVDHAIQMPLALAFSRKHNDMLLCCPRGASLPLFVPPPCESLSIGALGRLVKRADRTYPSRLEPVEETQPDEGEAAKGEEVDYRGHDRVEILEKDNRLLRIENAELKKKLRFDSETWAKEIRRLRVESAELKKRLYFPQSQGQFSSPMWMPANVMTFAPMMQQDGFDRFGEGFGGHKLDSPMMVSSMLQVSGPSSVASGQASPSQGSVTPVPHGYCYAVPMSPHGQSIGSPSRGRNHRNQVHGFVTAVPVGNPGVPILISASRPPISAMAPPLPGSAEGAEHSPHSDGSHLERMLPTGLLSSTANSSRNSDVSGVGVERIPPGENELLQSFAVHPRNSKGNDDRWICIPSGIVERHVAQFQNIGVPEANEDDGGIPGDVQSSGTAGAVSPMRTEERDDSMSPPKQLSKSNNCGAFEENVAHESDDEDELAYTREGVQHLPTPEASDDEWCWRPKV
eukprot:TRINITY_DN61955_c0_g1_i1.p1 TRINITY_DN61955_c0_g1~~TRINITY_DN61955_c0_g1_i1.p1  ORF type:complete len:678 (-),score=111.23 TRINITY_DN61955_c0_g1_i1:15-2048(-)